MSKSKEPWGATFATVFATVIGGAFVVIVGALLPVQQLANDLSTLLRFFLAGMTILFVWMAWYYHEILGGADDPRGSMERNNYESLRLTLATGGTPAKVYANLLEWLLHKVDKFFGDAGRDDRSWFARRLGLETPGPRWTAPAFDKCLLLALVYPILTIYIVWFLTGEVVDDVKKAVHLPDLSGQSVGYSVLSRGLFGFGLVILIYVFWRGLRAKRLITMLLWMCAPIGFTFLLGLISFPIIVFILIYSGQSPPPPPLLPRTDFPLTTMLIINLLIIGLKSLMIYGFIAALLVSLSFVIIIFLFSFHLAFAFAIADTIAGIFAGVFAFSVTVALAFSVGLFSTVVLAGVHAIKSAFNLTDALNASYTASAAADVRALYEVVVGDFAGAIAGVIALVFICAASVGVISKRSAQKGYQGIFLLLFVTACLLAAFAGAYFISTSVSWHISGPILLVFGVLTLVNAPFDWVAIGLTRALLRRGLAPGGRGPYFYALIDAIVAVPLIMLLAFVTVVAVQTFDDIAVLRTGQQEAQILPLAPLFERLENNPGDPKLWWVWLMLFSTLIPSLCNLVIGAAAFVRGLPFINNWILSRMPIGKAMRDSDRLCVASALAGHFAGGILISGVLVYLLFAHAVPFGLAVFGPYLRDFSKMLADYNAPYQIMNWFAGAH